MNAAIAHLRRPALLRRRSVLQPTTLAPPTLDVVPSDMGDLCAVRDDVFVPWMRHYQYWEPEETATLRAWLEPGMTFVDVGAHAGYFTIVGAECVGSRGRVVSFEPEGGNFSALVENLRRRRLRNVAAVNVAVWDAPGSVALSVSVDNSGDHRTGAEDGGVQVAATSLDEALGNSFRVDVVKIDVQGVEHRVLRGAAELIMKWRPRIAVEFWPEGIVDVDAASVPDLYRAMGYRLRGIEAQFAEDASGAEIVAAARSAEHGFVTLALEPE